MSESNGNDFNSFKKFASDDPANPKNSVAIALYSVGVLIMIVGLICGLSLGTIGSGYSQEFSATIFSVYFFSGVVSGVILD